MNAYLYNNFTNFWVDHEFIYLDHVVQLLLGLCVYPLLTLHMF